ncbi:hypothetical protein MON38_03705 [Hymenobacter sp. DH14]|uniref:G-D-S-L family lipolytic protein n=1 Tax=Hymenobacter cyanobacteriorum TaxID=2926463 RepID=A0A9X1VCA7_9BACT|nr:hypothetical protein [Hymenobacter cyanobacteriorum]MCI1186509.1 hypothetical protein [Hymenobacter cyanobacteriorum]
MMKMYSLLSTSTWARLGAASALLLSACAPGQDAPTPSTGIDASRYVAVGDSYTAGLSNGGVTHASQDYSFPNQLAQQFSRANANATFTQPYLDGTGSGYLQFVDLTATGLARVRRVAGQAVVRTVISPAACGGPDTVRVLTRSATAGTLPQNLGLPGLQLSQIETVGLGNATNAVPGGTFNPYFERLLPAADSRTYLQAVTTAGASATFFTYFLGLDTMLPYLRSGGECGLPSTALLNANARKVLAALTTGGRQGMIARLPALTNLPLLRLGRGLALQSRLQASAGDTARVYIEDPFNFGPAQAITNDDYVLATALPRIGQRTAVVVNGTTLQLPYGRDIRNPVRDADVLDKTELARINLVVNGHNTELENIATLYKMPIALDSKRTLDSNAAFPNFVGESILVNGVTYSGEPVRGNFYSLDNYSLTPRGNALLANVFILAINSAYRANIPAIEVNKLPTSVQ